MICQVDLGPFFVIWYTCLVRFSHLLRLCNFCKAPQDMRKFPQKYQKIAGCWECAVYGSLPPIASKPGSSSPERTGLNNITSQSWSDATCPCTTSSSAYFHFVTLFLFERQDKVLEAVEQGKVAWDHGWLVILSRLVRSGGDEPGFKAIGGLSLGRDIFWHFCRNFHNVRGPLNKLLFRSKYEKRTWHVFCTSSQKRVGKSIRTFCP